MEHGRLKRLLEFLVIGIVFGVTEDMLAVLIATDATFSLDILVVVVAIAIPFAIISELIVDHPRFLHFDRVASWVRQSLLGISVPESPPGKLEQETAPVTHHSYRCAICGDAFETGALLQAHVDRVHPNTRLSWEITVHPGQA